jgi:hypothetical protein
VEATVQPEEVQTVLSYPYRYYISKSYLKQLSFFDVQDAEKETDYPGFDIPIFTEEFLDHNKGELIHVLAEI